MDPYEPTVASASVPCPSCGGAGGGPIGRAGSAWDDDNYVCPRCEGVGVISREELAAMQSRPGLAKAEPTAVPARNPVKKTQAG